MAPIWLESEGPLKHANEYFKLNQSLRMFPENMVRNLIIDNPPTNGDSDTPYIVGGERCRKFAILDINPKFDSIRLLYHMKNLKSSDPIVLPKYRAIFPITVAKTFFTASFNRAVAILESVGFLRTFEDYRHRWDLCNAVQSLTDYLRNETNNV